MSSDKFRSQWSKATQRMEIPDDSWLEMELRQTSGALRYSTIPVSEANVEIHESP